MNTDQLLKDILAMIYHVKESKEDLQKIHDFMSENIFFEEGRKKTWLSLKSIRKPLPKLPIIFSADLFARLIKRQWK